MKHSISRNPFLKLKSKLGLYLVVPTTSKTSRNKLTRTVDEMQQLPNIEETNSKEEISCLTWTKNDGRQNLCEKHDTDTDNLKIVVCRY